MGGCFIKTLLTCHREGYLQQKYLYSKEVICVLSGVEHSISHVSLAFDGLPFLCTCKCHSLREEKSESEPFKRDDMSGRMGVMFIVRAIVLGERLLPAYRQLSWSKIHWKHTSMKARGQVTSQHLLKAIKVPIQTGLLKSPGVNWIWVLWQWLGHFITFRSNLK